MFEWTEELQMISPAPTVLTIPISILDYIVFVCKVSRSAAAHPNG